MQDSVQEKYYQALAANLTYQEVCNNLFYLELYRLRTQGDRDRPLPTWLQGLESGYLKLKQQIEDNTLRNLY